MNPETTPVVIDTRPNARFMIGSFLARYPEPTRYLYRIHIRHWWEWCESHGVDPIAAKRGHIEAFGRHLIEELGRKPQTVRGKLTAIRVFYKYAYLDGMIDNDPSQHITRPKIPFVSTSKALTRPELADVLRLARDGDPHTLAMIMLLSLNLLRIGETLSINCDHLDHQRGYRTLFLPHRKGGRQQTQSLSIPTAWAIEACRGDRTEGPLLLGRDGERLKVGSARRRIARLVADAGIRKRITPHSLRHTGVTLALDAGASQHDLVTLAGWASPEMLGYYDHNGDAVERSPTHLLSAYVGIAS